MFLDLSGERRNCVAQRGGAKGDCQDLEAASRAYENVCQRLEYMSRIEDTWCFPSVCSGVGWVLHLVLYMILSVSEEYNIGKNIKWQYV